MKNTTLKITAFAVFGAFALTACQPKENKEAAEQTSVSTDISGTFTADTGLSKILWYGKKVTGEHNGSVNLKEASFVLENGALKSGNAVVDMTTITVADLTDAEWNAKLKGHLESPDFFNVAEFPTAKLSITGANSSDLTIKGITKPVTFETTVGGANGVVVVSGSVTIDRTNYDIRYGSGKFFEDLGDKTISDEFTLRFNIVSQ